VIASFCLPASKLQYGATARGAGGRSSSTPVSSASERIVGRWVSGSCSWVDTVICIREDNNVVPRSHHAERFILPNISRRTTDSPEWYLMRGYFHVGSVLTAQFHVFRANNEGLAFDAANVLRFACISVPRDEAGDQVILFSGIPFFFFSGRRQLSLARSGDVVADMAWSLNTDLSR